jgi:hypothetical protein
VFLSSREVLQVQSRVWKRTRSTTSSFSSPPRSPALLIPLDGRQARTVTVLGPETPTSLLPALHRANSSTSSPPFRSPFRAFPPRPAGKDRRRVVTVGYSSAYKPSDLDLELTHLPLLLDSSIRPPFLPPSQLLSCLRLRIVTSKQQTTIELLRAVRAELIDPPGRQSRAKRFFPPTLFRQTLPTSQSALPERL